MSSNEQKVDLAIEMTSAILQICWDSTGELWPGLPEELRKEKFVKRLGARRPALAHGE